MPATLPAPDQPPTKPQTTRSLLRCIWGHLSRRRRVQLGVLSLVMMGSAAAELVSLGSVLPFLAVLSDSEWLWQQPLIQELALRAGFFSGPEQLLLPATAAFAVAALLAALVRLINLWLNGRLAAAIGSDLSGEAYRRTLYQPYFVHVQRNSSMVINTITYGVTRSIVALNAFFLMATSLVVAGGLFIGLLLIDWRVALATSMLFGSAYSVIAVVNQSKLSRNSSQMTVSSSRLLKAVQEGLGAIRDVLIDGSQPYYLDIYFQADRRQRKLEAQNNFLVAFPRFGLEAVGMVTLALLGFILVIQKGSGIAVIPLLGAMALGAQRLLPAMQQVYGGWALLKGYNADLSGLIELLEQPLPPSYRATEAMNWYQSIQLKGVRYRYAQNLPEVLKGLDMEIWRGQRVGLIGSTGSGKSTTVDLLMGLLPPSEGRLMVDGLDLYNPMHPERVLSWRATIAHVPQSIYLADASIAENIAFGIPKEQIDMARVRDAAVQAQIAAFIESCSEGYGSYVGERGIRLSGGQRQRIGIARALYRRASVLVFDEATSSLDNETEMGVIESINNLSKNLTVIMIAHRLSTLQSCDLLIELKDGQIHPARLDKQLS